MCVNFIGQQKLFLWDGVKVNNEHCSLNSLKPFFHMLGLLRIGPNSGPCHPIQSNPGGKFLIQRPRSHRLWVPAAMQIFLIDPQFPTTPCHCKFQPAKCCHDLHQKDFSFSFSPCHTCTAAPVGSAHSVKNEIQLHLLFIKPSLKWTR